MPELSAETAAREWSRYVWRPAVGGAVLGAVTGLDMGIEHRGYAPSLGFGVFLIGLFLALLAALALVPWARTRKTAACFFAVAMGMWPLAVITFTISEYLSR